MQKQCQLREAEIFFTGSYQRGEVGRMRQCSSVGVPWWQLDQPCLLPPSQTTAWAIFSQDTRAAVLALWPHPRPNATGINCQDRWGFGMAGPSSGGGGLFLSPSTPPCIELHPGSENTSSRGTETWGRRGGGRMEWGRERGWTLEIDVGFELCFYCRLVYRSLTLHHV